MAAESDHLRYLQRQPDPLIGEDEPTADVLVPPPAGIEQERQAPEQPPDADGVSCNPPGDAGPEAGGVIGCSRDAFEPGRVLCGRYELERVVGRGGSCVVLGASDLRRQAAGDAEAKVAIKALRPELRHDDDARRRLIAEFRQLQQLSHPGIVRVYDLDRHGDDWFLVMELLEGASLAGLMMHGEGGQVPTGEALDIVRACADALGWAHGRGVVHGDVKPGNVFVTRDEGIRLLDFGTAAPRQDVDAAAEVNRAVFATPAYASPQVMQGLQPAVADDVYSLACVAFELLSGVHPFDRVEAREACSRGMQPKETPELGTVARAALERGLSFDRDQRPASLAAFIALLDTALPVPGGPVHVAAESAGSQDRRRGWPVGWLVAAAALAGLVAAVLLRGGGSATATRHAIAPAAPGAAVPAQVAERSQEAVPVAGEPSAAGPEAEAHAAAPEPARGPAPAAANAAQRVEFVADPLLVSRTAPAAAIPLRRSNGSAGRAVVTWRIAEGSARSGRDFAGPLSGTLVLADGQEAGTVFVPLLAASGALDDRSFAVIIDQVRGPVRAGERTRVDVTLRSFIRDEPLSLATRD